MFEYRKDKKGKIRWTIKSPNGLIVGASSQGFSRKYHAKYNAKAILKYLKKEFKK